MACHAPLRAFRTSAGVTFRRSDELPQLALPCGGCLGCRMAKALAWSIRCALESQIHESASFVTLTYSDDYVPPSLRVDHLSQWLKRVRARVPDRRLRFFGCGEYGDQFKRPHYHVLLFGGARDHQPLYESAWAKGFVRADTVTPASIAYVCGYVTKKQQQRRYDRSRTECVDPVTGEVYTYQPPFQLMSRRPGIGAHARQHWRSWKECAIWHGRPAPVPRYLHEAWRKNAAPGELDELQAKRLHHRLDHTDVSYDHAAARAAHDHTLLANLMSYRGEYT